MGDVEEPQNDKIGYSNMKLDELKTIAKSKGIEGYSKMKKDELIEKLV